MPLTEEYNGIEISYDYLKVCNYFNRKFFNYMKDNSIRKNDNTLFSYFKKDVDKKINTLIKTSYEYHSIFLLEKCTIFPRVEPKDCWSRIELLTRESDDFEVDIDTISIQGTHSDLKFFSEIDILTLSEIQYFSLNRIKDYDYHFEFYLNPIF